MGRLATIAGLLCLCVTLIQAQKPDLWISLYTSGEFQIGTTTSIDQHTSYFHSAPTFLTYQGKRVSTDNGGLKSNASYGTSGQDRLGPWQSLMNRYSVGNYTVETTLKTYQTEWPPVVIWTQRFPKGLNLSKAENFNLTSTGYPSIHFSKNENLSLGYLSFGGYMFGDRSKKYGVWDPATAEINDGMLGSGPLAVFDKGGNCFLFSPFSSFMAASLWHDRNQSTLSWGIMGGVDSLPPGFEMSTIVYYSNEGINKAFEGWGRAMRLYYDKTDDLKKTDLSLNYLGYWTDNGGYYYYNTEPKKNYAETLLDVAMYLENSSFPAKYLQLDSWWYPKDSHLAVVTWDAMPSVFPDGLVQFSKSLNLSIVAHNRYWSLNTTYAKQNGGKFNFIKEQYLSLPNEEAFWDYLFETAKNWSLIVYEQDWLNVQVQYMQALQTDAGLGRRWLQQMGRAALDKGLTLQYCMALSRHALQSLEIPAVTQARVSDDYQLQHDQWKIGVASMFADAMGVAPSKDTFWTSSVEPGNPFNKTEPHPELQALVSVLSTGPVGPSDKIGLLNVSMMMQCCREDGMILKPSKPATAIDAQVIEMAFQDGSGVEGEVWTTYSDLGDFRFGYILTANLSRPFNITPQSLGLTRDNDKYEDLVIMRWDAKSVHPFNSSTGFELPPNSNNETSDDFFSFYMTSPVLYFDSDEYILLGEPKKWLRFSPQRVFRVWQTPDFLAVTYTGKLGEQVEFDFLRNRHLGQIFTAIDSNNGCATFVVYNKGNSSIVPDDLNCLPPKPTPSPTPSPTPATSAPPPPSTTHSNGGTTLSKTGMSCVLLVSLLALLGLLV